MKIKFLTGVIITTLTILSFLLSFFLYNLNLSKASDLSFLIFMDLLLMTFLWIWVVIPFGDGDAIKKIIKSFNSFPSNGLSFIGFLFIFISLFFLVYFWKYFIGQEVVTGPAGIYLLIPYIGLFFFYIFTSCGISLSVDSIEDLFKRETSLIRKTKIFLSSLFVIIMMILIGLLSYYLIKI